jgi:hypothetical protein
MTSDNRNLIAKGISQFAGTSFDVGVGGGDAEQADFLWDLEEVLAQAGWHQAPWNIVVPGTMTINRNLRPVAGAVSAQNLEIHLDPSWDAKFRPAAQALVDALNSIGLQAQISPYNAVSGNPMVMHILIGPKR